MSKYVIKLTQPPELTLHAGGIEQISCYSLKVDGVVINFQYPIVSIQKFSEKQKYILYFENGTSRIIECSNGRYNPEDPYTFLHDSGTYEFDKAISRVDCLPVVKECEDNTKDNISEKSDAKEIRQKGNCPVQSVRHLYDKRAIDVFFDKLYIVALENEMWSEAIALSKLMNEAGLKYSRSVVRDINRIEDYKVLIEKLAEFWDTVKMYPQLYHRF